MVLGGGQGFQLGGVGGAAQAIPQVHFPAQRAGQRIAVGRTALAAQGAGAVGGQPGAGLRPLRVAGQAGLQAGAADGEQGVAQAVVARQGLVHQAVEGRVAERLPPVGVGAGLAFGELLPVGRQLGRRALVVAVQAGAAGNGQGQGENEGQQGSVHGVILARGHRQGSGARRYAPAGSRTPGRSRWNRGRRRRSSRWRTPG